MSNILEEVVEAVKRESTDEDVIEIRAFCEQLDDLLDEKWQDWSSSDGSARAIIQSNALANKLMILAVGCEAVTCQHMVERGAAPRFKALATNRAAQYEQLILDAMKTCVLPILKRRVAQEMSIGEPKGHG